MWAMVAGIIHDVAELATLRLHVAAPACLHLGSHTGPTGELTDPKCHSPEMGRSRSSRSELCVYWGQQ